MSERSITTRILAYLAGRRAGRAIKLHGNAYQSAGEPDILYVEGCGFRPKRITDSDGNRSPVTIDSDH